MRRDLGLGARLAVVVMLCVTAILIASLGFYHHQARQLLLHRLHESAQNRSLALVQRVERLLISVQRSSETLARAIELADLDDARLTELLSRALEMNPDLFGLAMAFAPEVRKAAGGRYAPYAFRRDGAIVLELDQDDYLTTDWYRTPLERGRPDWSEPYFEAGAGYSHLIATYSLPVTHASPNARRFLGILAADIELDWLTRELAEFKVLKHGFAVLISRKGAILSHPETALIMRETLFTLVAAQPDGTLNGQVDAILGGTPGFIQDTPLFGVLAHVYHAPIAGSNWTLAIVFPKRELFGDINRLTLNAAIIGVVGLVISLMAVLLIARSISRPLRALARSTERIAEGDFEAPLPEVRRHDEVGDLTHSFAAMRVALRQYIEQLTATTAAKERIESELIIARDLQMSTLPRPLPLDRRGTTFALQALILPAREVGGDFYDFFFVEAHRLCFLIADVSGKGVPAALFMTMAKALLKSTARAGRGPAEILTLVNAELAHDNPNGMFVTAFCAILDARDGDLEYANAGHNPPVFLAANADPRLLKGKGPPQLMLGAIESVVYRSESLRLAPGDRLFLYTDGVTEAIDPAGALYSERRLLDCVTDPRARTPGELNAAILRAVQTFANGTPQSDDITLLTLEYLGDDPGRMIKGRIA